MNQYVHHTEDHNLFYEAEGSLSVFHKVIHHELIVAMVGKIGIDSGSGSQKNDLTFMYYSINFNLFLGNRWTYKIIFFSGMHVSWNTEKKTQFKLTEKPVLKFIRQIL